MIKKAHKLSVKASRKIYQKLPLKLQILTTVAYRRIRKVTGNPVQLSKAQNIEAKITIPVQTEILAVPTEKVDTIEVTAQSETIRICDIQNIENYLEINNATIFPNDNAAWIPLDNPIIIDIDGTNQTELQFSFRVRCNDVNYDAALFNVAVLNDDDAAPETAECKLFRSEGQIAFRILVGPSCRSFSIKLSGSYGDLEVSNNYSLRSVEKGISIVVPVFKEELLIGNLLRSLSNQELDRKYFEIIFIINGEIDRSIDIIREWLIPNSDISVRILTDSRASASNARNLGVTYSRFSHITFVDSDDTISMGYLTSMLNRIGFNYAPCAHIVDVFPNGNKVIDNRANATLLSIDDKRHFEPVNSGSFAMICACKAIPSFFVRCVPFHVHLKNGEDVPFYCEIYARFPNLRFNLDPELDVCAYYRYMRPVSLSRQKLNYQFHILDRLRVIKEISYVATLPQLSETQKYVTARMLGQVGFMADYLRAYPRDYLQVLREIELFNIPQFPIDYLKHHSSDQIVVAYCFPPYQDSSAIVMAKRIYEAGILCDVISNTMSSVREEDSRLLQPLKPYIASHRILNTPVSFAGWSAISSFIDKTLHEVSLIQTSRKRNYKRMYSRAQWVASHFAAIQIKLNYPEIMWTAEFSDPLLYGVDGGIRPGNLELDWLKTSGLIERLNELGVAFDADQTNLFYWCELATIHLADELVFTNKNQLEYMRGYLPSEKDKLTVDQKSVVSHHPVAKDWLQNHDRANEPQFTNLNLAYFGSFYVNRGAGQLLSAIRNLPENERSRIRVYIYSRQFKEALLEAEYLGIADIVICKPEIPYVDMISELQKFDLLVVNDAQVEQGKINPFLPSKLSDYRQTDVPILCVYQPGSAMSKMKDLKYRVSINLPVKKFEAKLRLTLKTAMADKRSRLLSQ